MGDKATDRELADFLVFHMEHPCVDFRTGLNIRDLYVREAEKVIKTFKDIYAEKMLREKIQQCSL